MAVRQITRRPIVILIFLLLAGPLAVQAQPAAGVYRVGFLGPGSAERVYTDLLPSLRAGLRDLGYVEGKNILLESRFAEDKYERLPELATELVRAKVDVIVVHTTPGTRAVKEATRTIPIVMAGVADPVGTGFVGTLARPGTHVTGVSNIDVGLAAKRVELLKEVMPRLSLLAVLRNPANSSGVPQLRETQEAGPVARR